MSETVPFEGVEKRLVIQFADGFVHHDSAVALGVGAKMKSPLAMSASEWQSLLDHASCTIVSQRELTAGCGSADEQQKRAGERVRVYLLSESTLTCWNSGFLMKTCGRTTPFLALHRLLQLYRCKSLRDLHVSWMTYSRLDFLYPEYQPSPHRTFEEELEFAQTYFTSVSDIKFECADSMSTSASDGSGSPDGRGGGALRSPPLEHTLHTTLSSSSTRSSLSEEGEDAAAGASLAGTGLSTLLPSPSSSSSQHVETCAGKNEEHFSYTALPAGEHVLYVMFFGPTNLPASGYAMEEVLMTGVREDCVRELTGADNGAERATTKVIDTSNSLLHRELTKSAHAAIDEFWFDPCGYSANVLLRKEGSETVDYFSTHISPEACTSYASLEVGTWRPAPFLARPCSHDEDCDTALLLKPLVVPFASQHRNYTRIVIRPWLRGALDPLLDHDSSRSGGRSHIFNGHRFRCEVLHFAE